MPKSICLIVIPVNLTKNNKTALLYLFIYFSLFILFYLFI